MKYNSCLFRYSGSQSSYTVTNEASTQTEDVNSIKTEDVNPVLHQFRSVLLANVSLMSLSFVKKATNAKILIAKGE